jgi:hypothetical protein
VSIVALMAGGFAIAESPDPTKLFQVEGTVNSNPSFMLRVSVDKPSRVYYDGETLTVTVKSERDCYLQLNYYQGDHAVVLFPNKYQQDNFVPGDREVTIPRPGSNFQITCRPPFGEGVLHAIATLRPVQLIDKDFTVEPVTPIDQQDLRQMVSHVQKQKKDEYAEHFIQLVTTERGEKLRPDDKPRPAQDDKPRPDQDDKPRPDQDDKPKPHQEKPRPAQADPVQGKPRPNIGTQTPRASTPDQGQRGPKRFGVCIGISKYQDSRIQQLLVSHRDAEQMAEVLKDQCQVDEVTTLTNENATRQAIEQLIFADTVSKTQPGDTVFIFFSCHGGRTSDTNGDEEDGFDEYLVPHDGKLGKPETMILDDTFGRWIQQLDGRQIAVILDNCYSGGASKAVKGLAGPRLSGDKVDFFDGELRRAKDLGQRDTAVLAACKPNELAWEMPSSGSGSVLTYYVLQSVSDPAADENGDGKLSMSEVFHYVQQPIQQYVQQTFSATQTPLLIDNADDRIMFKP